MDGSGGSWVKSTLDLDTDTKSFQGGRLKLKCVGSIFSLNRRSAEVKIEEEKPRSASVKAGTGSGDETKKNSGELD